MKTFGIYLAYGPRVNMRGEGLGRLLAEFLKASSEFNDVRFVIAAPAWLREPLRDLFAEFQIDQSAIEIISPRRPSLIAALYHSATFVMERRRKLRKKRRATGYLEKQIAMILSFTRSAGLRIVRSRNPLTFIAASFAIILVAPVAACGLILSAALSSFLRLTQRSKSAIRQIIFRRGTKVKRVLKSVSHLAYRLMCDVEASAVAELATSRQDVAAWYSPASFWPEFNSIKAPRVMCVPDAVQTRYSIPFAADGLSPERGVTDFKRLEDAIENGDRFVTYSEDVKQHTLVEHFNVDPGRVAVARHGANRLDHLVQVSGFADNDAATDALSAVHLWSSFSKAMNNRQAEWFASQHAGFLFYASQIRPNKNVLTLLKAYYYLRSQKGLPYRLVLTGDLDQSPAVRQFVDKRHLHNDVLFVRGLSEVELASCYRLATLSINPSLAEGGMPFTFTESVSVGTPVIMADIPVTREILVEEKVARATLFDPFDFRALAAKIESALEQKGDLLALQSDFYSRVLVGRTYRDVVEETIAILDAAAASWQGRTEQKGKIWMSGK